MPFAGLSRRRWFALHSWLGLSFYLVLAVILLSGSVAVVARELDWLLYPAMRVAPGGERRGVGELLDALARAHPDVALLDGYFATHADEPRTAAGGIGVSTARGVRVYWIDPYTAEVTGDTPLLSLGTVAARLHASLFIPAVGDAIVSLFAVFLLTSTVTGLMTYRRWWRGYGRRLRSERSRVWLGDLHRLLGVWLLPFLLVMVSTGLVYTWDFVGTGWLDLPARPLRSAPLEIPVESLARLGPGVPARQPLDALLAVVAQRRPDFVVTAVLLPEYAAAPFTALGHRGEWLVDPRMSRIDLDPYSGAVLSESLLGDADLGQRLHQAVNPLHFGFFGGLATKLVWVGCGLALAALAMSGVWIHLQRLAARGVRRRSWWRPVGGASGRLKPLNLAVLAFGAVGAVGFALFTAAPLTRVGAEWPTQAFGPWRAAVVAIEETALFGRGAPLAPGAHVLMVLDLAPEHFAAMRDAQLEIGSREGAPLTRARIEGSQAYLHAHVTMPDSIPADAELRVVGEAWDGQVHTARWPLMP